MLYLLIIRSIASECNLTSWTYMHITRVYLQLSTVRPDRNLCTPPTFQCTGDLASRYRYVGQLKRTSGRGPRVSRYHSGCSQFVVDLVSDLLRISKRCGCELGVRECSNAELTTTSAEIWEPSAYWQSLWSIPFRRSSSSYDLNHDHAPKGKCLQGANIGKFRNPVPRGSNQDPSQIERFHLYLVHIKIPGTQNSSRRVVSSL